MDVILEVVDLVEDKVDDSREINRIGNLPMISLVRNHYRLRMPPPPPLVSLVVVRSCLILLVRYVMESGTLHYNVNNNSIMPLLLPICRTHSQLSRLMRPLIQLGILTVERQHT